MSERVAWRKREKRRKTNERGKEGNDRQLVLFSSQGEEMDETHLTHLVSERKMNAYLGGVRKVITK